MVSMPRGELTYRRGDIRWVALDLTLGAEIQKTRSCLILQNDLINQYGQLTIILPFRPGQKNAPYVVNVTATPENGLDQNRFIEIAQIRSVDTQRILGLMGRLEDHYWPQIKQALDIVLGFAL
jgi:mRNA interferase MazF